MLCGYQVLMAAARKEGIVVHPIAIREYTPESVREAVRAMLASGSKVVVLLTFDTELRKVLGATRQVISEEGKDYTSYTFIFGLVAAQVWNNANLSISCTVPARRSYHNTLLRSKYRAQRYRSHAHGSHTVW
jgi:hypothetical protein